MENCVYCIVLPRHNCGAQESKEVDLAGMNHTHTAYRCSKTDSDGPRSIGQQVNDVQVLLEKLANGYGSRGST